MSLASRASIPLTSALLVGAGLVALPPAPVNAASSLLCSGWSGCVAKGYSDAGYGAASRSSYWNMYAGHNCTNYVAYRMIKAGMSSTRPFSGTGNAWNWGTQMAAQTDATPVVGAVAWWNQGVRSAGSVGHVAYVEQVISPTEIIVSEDSWGGDFDWRRITTSSGWPSGFIHLTDGGAANTAANTVTNTAPISIGGAVAVGQTVTANPGGWSPAATVGYQWLVDGAPLAGATTATLRITSALTDRALSLQVKASAAGLTPGSATTSPVSVARAALTPSSAPTVTSDAKNIKVGTTLTAGQVTFSPPARRVSVQWYANGVPIEGAKDWSYKVGAADVETAVTAVVTGKRPGYARAPATSAPQGPVVGGRVKVTTPARIAGRALVGRTMKVSGGEMSPSDATTTYVWQRDGKAIDGANGATYVLSAADIGARMSVSMKIAHVGWLTRSTSLERDARVAVSPVLKLRTASRKGRTTIWFRVDGPGVGRPVGRARVTVGAKTREVVVRKGVGRLRLNGVGAGKRAVEVRWLGTKKVAAASAQAKVLVRR